MRSAIVTGGRVAWLTVTSIPPMVPSVLAAAGKSDPGMDVFQQLLRNRIVFLGTSVTEESANLVCAQMLLLAAEDPDKDISFYINSPGGSVYAGMAVYDTMQLVPCDVSTTVMGMAASMGQFLLCAGAPGKRYALPHSRVLMHQPSAQFEGQAADIAIHAQQIVHIKKQMFELISEHTGKPVEQVSADADRDRWFTAEEALDYGFVDEIVKKTESVKPD